MLKADTLLENQISLNFDTLRISYKVELFKIVEIYIAEHTCDKAGRLSLLGEEIYQVYRCAIPSTVMHCLEYPISHSVLSSIDTSVRYFVPLYWSLAD